MNTVSNDEFRHCRCSVPIRQIHETRCQFPGAAISHEIQLEIVDVWAGLQDISGAFKQSGLKCRSIRYAEGGTVFLRLDDCADGKLTLLDTVFRQHSDVRLQSWTIQLSPRSSDSGADKYRAVAAS